MAAKYYCDRCGKELFWSTNYDTGENYSGNTDGYKTFDSETKQWLDLCNNCRYQRERNPEGYYPDQNWMTLEGATQFADGSIGVITKIS